jgi:hypothetical protein
MRGRGGQRARPARGDDAGHAVAVRGGAGRASIEDAWQRSVEFLFERLAVSWTIAGAEPISVRRAARALSLRQRRSGRSAACCAST